MTSSWRACLLPRLSLGAGTWNGGGNAERAEEAPLDRGAQGRTHG